MECDRNVDTWDCMWQRVIQGISSIETYALWIIMCFIARMMYLSLCCLSASRALSHGKLIFVAVTWDNQFLMAITG